MNWALEDVIEFVEACYDRDTILDVLMGYSAHWFPSRMILIVGRAWVQLFATTAFNLPSEIARDQRRADVDDDAPAINDEVSTGTAGEVGLGQLFTQLDLGDPLVRTIGVKIGARVAIVLVGAVPDDDVATAALEHAAATAGRQLEDVIRMAKANELPPPEERVPPFPAIAEARRAPGSDAEVTGRTTQNLEQAFNHEDAVSTPRLARTVPADDSGERPVVEPAATSFGLPFIEGEEVAAPGRQVADSSVDRAALFSEMSGASQRAADSDGLVSSPFDDEAFPGDVEIDVPNDEGMEEDSDVIELTEKSGVTMVSPTDISSSETKRTQLGGVGVASDLARETDRPPRSLTDTGTQIGEPQMISDPRSTQIGGVSGEQEIVTDTLERAESQAAAAVAGDVLAAHEAPDEKLSGPHGAWVNARTKDGVPAAMILKPARNRSKRTKRVSQPSEPGSESATPTAKQTPGRSANPTPVANASDLEQIATESKPDSSPASLPLDASQPTGSGEPSKRDGSKEEPTSAIDAAGASSSPSSEPQTPAGGTNLGGGWSRAQQKTTRKFDADGEVDDAWFDYFADSAVNESRPDEEHAALNFSLSEPSDDPHTIPPETLERLLDSGPEMIDMQEQFMTLDSRDREKAFEAADRVAELGERAIEVLDLMFPGRVFLDRYQHTDDLPPVDKHGPVLHALVRLGDLSLPVASRHLTDSSNEARFYAVYLLTKLDAEPVLNDLFERLFDRDQQIRNIAAELVLQYQSASAFDDNVRDKIRAELLSGDDVHVTVAANLLSKLRDTDAVVTLIDAMDDSATPRVKLAILHALTEITLHHWSSPYEWRQWWRNGKNETRETWIVEALDASTPELRQQAYEEVQRIPGLELNYHPDQPSKLRKRAQRELQSWFDKASK